MSGFITLGVSSTMHRTCEKIKNEYLNGRTSETSTLAPPVCHRPDFILQVIVLTQVNEDKDRGWFPCTQHPCFG